MNHHDCRRHLYASNTRIQILGRVWDRRVPWLGSGLGAYFAWVNLSIPWYFVLLTICVVLIGGVASAFGGMVYGSFVEQSYLGRAYTIDNNLHWGAAVGGIFVATCVGLFNQLVTQRRLVG